MSGHLGTDEKQTRLKKPSGSPRRTATLPLAAALLLAVVLISAACGAANPGDGSGSTSTTGTDGAISHPTGANEIVLQVTHGGGFVPVEYNLTMVPQFSLYGDGRVIVSGPVIAIYPPPALPNLQTTVISEESVQAILSAAREAGLFDPTVDYGQPGITDVGTTTIVINADGTTYRSDIYALGMESGAGGLTLEQQQARAAIDELRNKLIDLSAFETGELTWTPYEYSALAVYSQAVDPGATTDPTDIQPNQPPVAAGGSEHSRRAGAARWIQAVRRLRPRPGHAQASCAAGDHYHSLEERGPGIPPVLQASAPRRDGLAAPAARGAKAA